MGHGVNKRGEFAGQIASPPRILPYKSGSRIRCWRFPNPRALFVAPVNTVDPSISCLDCACASSSRKSSKFEGHARVQTVVRKGQDEGLATREFRRAAERRGPRQDSD